MNDAIYENYKIDSITACGVRIKEILFASDKYIIYIDQNDVLQCEYDDTKCIDCDKSVRDAFYLQGQLNALYISEKNKKIGRELITSALNHALDSRRTNDNTDYFEDARYFIQIKSSEALQCIYLLSALFSAILIIIILESCFSFSRLINIELPRTALAISFGAFGALLSVLQRFRKITIRPYASHYSNIIEGFGRIILGSLFGLVFLILANANLLLGVINDNIFAITIFSLIAGFNERFVPDLLEQAQSTIRVKSKTK